jgi:hypothetical protein
MTSNALYRRKVKRTTRNNFVPKQLMGQWPLIANVWDNVFAGDRLD